MLEVIKNHRSVRHYLDKPIPDDVMNTMLTAATRASTVGSMQLYSMVVNTDQEMKKALAPCHFNQPMVTQAPAVVTFCADVARFEQWCRLRDASPHYECFVWYINAAIDAILASENFALEAQNQGLGICYLGTTIYNADKISDILELPRGVVPVVALTVGYADPEMYPENTTARLPLQAVVHHEKYKQYTDDRINELWREIENSEQTGKLLSDNDLPNLARIFTERRYKREDNITFSACYMEALKRQGFI